MVINRVCTELGVLNVLSVLCGKKLNMPVSTIGELTIWGKYI